MGLRPGQCRHSVNRCRTFHLVPAACGREPPLAHVLPLSPLPVTTLGEQAKRTCTVGKMLLLGDEDEDDEDRLGTPPLPDPQGAEEEEEEEDGADLGAGDDIDTGEAGDGGMVGAEDLATLIFHPATDTYYDPETGKHYAADLAAGDG